ncbi:MAG: hypothetical protein ACLUEU_07855 [Oscillospiraceae bacterium]
MEKMIQIAESYGWAVDMDSDSIEFNQCSPAGEDFSFTVLTKDASDAESLAAEVRSYADSFDTEEHVKMLVDAQGSVSGVPDIETLVEDADAIQVRCSTTLLTLLKMATPTQMTRRLKPAASKALTSGF